MTKTRARNTELATEISSETDQEVLYDHLIEKPGLYLDEMAIFLWEEFQMLSQDSSTADYRVDYVTSPMEFYCAFTASSSALVFNWPYAYAVASNHTDQAALHAAGSSHAAEWCFL